MLNRFIFFAAAPTSIFLVAILSPGCGPDRGGGDAPSVEFGAHLVAIAGCHDCHTPFKLGPDGPEPDMSRSLSGHPAGVSADEPPAFPQQGPWLWAGAATNTAYAGPWGITYATNLTPDESTGMGIWTEEMFVQAMRSGRHMGQSRPIQPPMPWRAYAAMTDRELKSIYAYLRTIPPIENLVPDYRPPEEIGLDGGL